MNVSDALSCFFGVYFTMAAMVTIVSAAMGSLEKEMEPVALRLIAGAWLWPVILPVRLLMSVGEAVFGKVR